MVVAAGLQGHAVAALVHQRDAALPGHALADAGDGDAGAAGDARHVLAGVLRGGEQQLVVFAAGEGALEVAGAGHPREGGRQGHSRRVHHGAGAAGLADVAQVLGEAVAHVHHGVGQALPGQQHAGLHARRGVVVPPHQVVPVARGHPGPRVRKQRQPQRRIPQGAGDVDVVSHPGAGARDRPVRRLAGEEHVDGEPVGGAGVAPHQRDALLGRQCLDAVDEGRGLPRVDVRKSQGEEEERRTPAHGGDVAQAGGEGLVSEVLHRDPLAVEVDAFDEQIRGEQQRVAGGGHPGGIVADAEPYPAPARGVPLDQVDEPEFSQVAESHGRRRVFLAGERAGRSSSRPSRQVMESRRATMRSPAPSCPVRSWGGSAAPFSWPSRWFRIRVP